MKKKIIINYGIKLGLGNNTIELIILKTTGLSKNQLFLLDEIEDKYYLVIEKFFKDFIIGVPIEYIIEDANFYGLGFFVDNRVLIPRNDTEVMVDEALITINKLSNKLVSIDVGTGSSCIPISVLENTNKIDKYFALDISNEALEVARININKYNLEDKIKLIESNLLEYFLIGKISLLEKSNLIITANLPYIKDKDFDNMDKETIKYEPDLALYGGKKTGFEMYEKLISQIFKLKNIYKIITIDLFIEIGFDQKEVAEKFLNKNNLRYQIFKDNGGIERCIKIDF